MPSLTLKQLRYFESLARSGHFGRAADACAISQPALSLQIREMEEALGGALFERGARQVRLTPLGESLAPRIRDILRGVDELSDLARAAQGPFAGRLRIGIIPTVAPYLLPGLMRNLAVQYSGLDIHIRETLTAKLLQELSDGRLDAAIVALPVNDPAFDEVTLFTEQFVLVRPAADQDRPAPRLENLGGLRLLLLEEGHCFRDQALSFCKMNAVLPREVLEGSTLSTLVQMVGAGIGVTLIPEIAVRVETRAVAVCVAPFEEPRPSRTMGMIWRKTSPLREQLTRIASVARDCAGELLPRPEEVRRTPPKAARRAAR